MHLHSDQVPENNDEQEDETINQKNFQESLSFASPFNSNIITTRNGLSPHPRESDPRNITSA